MMEKDCQMSATSSMLAPTMVTKLSWLGLLAGALFVSTAQASNDSVETQVDEAGAVTRLETVLVTGTRIAARGNPISGLTTVITREAIEARADENIIDLLRGQSGVHVAQAGGRGGVASVQLRGGDPNFTLVLVDGIKVNDPTNARGGSFDFSALPLAQVERIEITRGAQSSVYGSDGLAGVIQIPPRESATAAGGGDIPLAAQGLRRTCTSRSAA